MTEPLSHRIENAIQIAWDYLERTGQIDDPGFTGRFLIEIIGSMIRGGEQRRLVLSNRAITAYEKLRQAQAA